MIRERLAQLDASIMRGLADVEAGRTVPAAHVFGRLEDKYRQLADKKVDPGSSPG